MFVMSAQTSPGESSLYKWTHVKLSHPLLVTPLSLPSVTTVQDSLPLPLCSPTPPSPCFFIGFNHLLSVVKQLSALRGLAASGGVGGACDDVSHTYQSSRTDHLRLSLPLYLLLRLSYARAQTAAECRATRFFFFLSSYWNRKQKEEERDVIRGGSTEEYLIHKTLSV